MHITDGPAPAQPQRVPESSDLLASIETALPAAAKVLLKSAFRLFSSFQNLRLGGVKLGVTFRLPFQ